jgi:DHA3 family macrolide efflux protein-like MFS transporter
MSIRSNVKIKEKSLTNQKARPILNLLQNQHFLFLWVASTFSGLALSIYLITESWFVVKGLKLESWLGIVMMMTTIPRVLLMSIGGVIADRFKRSHVLFYSNIIRGLFIFGMVLLLGHHFLNVWLLSVFAFSYGILDAFFWPSSNSFIPLIVEKQHITRANSFIQTTNQFSLMIGPAIAGFIIKFGSFQSSFGAAAGLLIISGILVRFMKENGYEERKSAKKSLSKDLKEGFIYIKGVPYLLTVMCTSVVVNLFLVGPTNIGLPIIVNKILNGNVMDLSYLETSLAIGMFLGALITGIVNFKRKRGVISLTLVGILGLTTALLSQMTSLYFGICVLALSGICLAISNIIGPSLSQELIEPKMMGRVQSLMSTASMGFTPLSYAVVSVLLSAGVSIQLVMLISCGAMSIFCFTCLWKMKVVWEVD